MRSVVCVLVIAAACGTDPSVHDKATCSGWMYPDGSSLTGECERGCASFAAVMSATNLGQCQASTVGDATVVKGDQAGSIGCDFTFEVDGVRGCCVAGSTPNSSLAVAFAECQ